MPMLQHYLDIARPYLDHYGFWAVFALVGVESFGIPAPGQSVVIAGALLASQGNMSIIALLATAWSAAVVGDNLGYCIGRYGGRRLVLKHGRLVGIRERHLQRVEKFFGRYGSEIVIIARFFEVLRQLNGVVAGMSNMPWLRFLVFNALGAALWVGIWGGGAYYLGQHIDAALMLFKRIEPYAIAAIVVAAGVLVVWPIRKHHRQDPHS